MFDEDDIAPPAVMLADALASADFAESGCAVECVGSGHHFDVHRLAAGRRTDGLGDGAERVGVDAIVGPFAALLAGDEARLGEQFHVV